MARQSKQTAAEWLAELFEYEYCAECSGAACHHTVVGSPLGHPFARCDYAPDEMTGAPHPVIAAYRVADDAGQPLPAPPSADLPWLVTDDETGPRTTPLARFATEAEGSAFIGRQPDAAKVHRGGYGLEGPTDDA